MRPEGFDSRFGRSKH